MYNNNGHCRKFDAGTMYSSCRIIKDEQHVTRGRANTLRLALSGQLGEDGLASRDVKETLDLCVSRKGCKRDCPTGVDMARIKIEARGVDAAEWHECARSTDRLSAALCAFRKPHAEAFRRDGSTYAARSAMAQDATWSRNPARVSALLEAIFNDDASSPRAKTASAKQVLLFVDTFNNYMEPENARGAARFRSRRIHRSSEHEDGRASLVLRTDFSFGGSRRRS